MSGGTRAGAGRKAKEIDGLELEKLCSMQCTDEEIAAWFSVSVKTIRNRRKQAPYAEVMRRGTAKGRISIRRAQLRLLEAGNASIAIWLGKTVLAQNDTMQITGADGGPVQTENKLDFSRLTVEELRILNAAMAKAAGENDV
jgi:hypothetical protein